MKNKIFVLGLMLVAVPLLAWGARAGYTAYLTGSMVMPSVKTEATGGALFELSPDGKALHFYISVQNLSNATAVHVYIGTAGQEGQPVSTLYPSGPAPQVKEGKFSGILARGIITADNLEGPLKGKPLSDLVKEIQGGNAYVQVLTKLHPAGELRGQIAKRTT